MAQKNKGIMKYTVAEAQNIQLGQGQSAYLDSTNAYVVDDAKPVIAITIIQDAKFETLAALHADYCFGDNGTDGTYTDAGCGDVVLNTTVFPAGITIYGSWTTVDLASGIVVLYLGG